MKRTYRIRMIALLLALSALASLALPTLASTIPGDVNGDNKISVFDAQMIMEVQAGLRTLTADQQEAADKTSLLDVIKTILGTMPGAIDSDGDGVLEIYTVQGLEYMAKNPSASYQLMNDIDMEGASWTPIRSFSGSLKGNGHIIRNFVISEDSTDTNNSKIKNMGFFGDTTLEATVSDLHLRDVVLTATEHAEYLGLLVGSNRCTMENVTATGIINDNRASHTTKAYIGALAGRVCTSDTPGTLIGGTSLPITDTAGVSTTSGLCADVKVYAADKAGVKLGLAGYYPPNATVSGQWVDTSNSISMFSETIQARRAEVVRYMNAMGSVQWTPVETLTYTDARGSKTTYKAGTTYYGLPYNHKSGSLERFLSAMQSQTDGVYTTKSGLGSSVLDASTGEVYGFVQLMGNDCSDAVGFAWMRVAPLIVADNANHHPPYHGGAWASGTTAMIPNDTNRAKYGIYAVGDYSDFSTIDTTTGMRVSTTYDPSQAAYVCTNENNTGAILLNNGADVMYEAYAKATQGDCMLAFATPWDDGTYGNAGHSRLIVADPIVIRNTDGSIDKNASYMITTEQGGGGSYHSTWRVNYRYSFKELLDDSADSGSTGYYRTYVPITMRALYDEHIRPSYINNYPAPDNVTAPNKGKIFSNYQIISTTVTVKDGENVVYENEIFTGVAPLNSVSGVKIQTANLSDHSEALAAAGLEAGKTYTFTVEVLLSDGNVFLSANNKSFVYEP